jgi:hypothetical protein
VILMPTTWTGLPPVFMLSGFAAVSPWWTRPAITSPSSGFGSLCRRYGRFALLVAIVEAFPQTKDFAIDVLMWRNLNHHRTVRGSNIRPAHCHTSLLPPTPRPSRYCQRIAAQNHQGNEPPNRPLAVRIGADKLGGITNRCGFSFDLRAAPPGAQQSSGRGRVGMQLESLTRKRNADNSSPIMSGA